MRERERERNEKKWIMKKGAEIKKGYKSLSEWKYAKMREIKKIENMQLKIRETKRRNGWKIRSKKK